MILAALSGCAGSPAPSGSAAGSTTQPSVSRADAAGAAMARLTAAWAGGDVSAAAALADPAQPRVGERLGAIAANVADLGLDDLGVRFRETGPSTGERWPGSLEVTWRARSDDGTATVAVPVTLRWEGERALVAALGAGAARMPLWLGGPVQSVSRSRWQVVGTAEGSLPRVIEAVRDARRAVATVLGPQRPLVVEVPADARGYAAVLGAAPGEYAALAAVTTTADGSTRPDAPLRIVLNPEQLNRSTGSGLAVVLAHEAVHVAMRDVTATTPRWFNEGFADYVALRGLGLPGLTRASTAELRRHGVPRRLPVGPAFAGSGRALEAAYERSRIACEVIAERVGEQGLLRLRVATASGQRRFAPALRQIAGLSLRSLEREWRLRLTEPVG